MARVAAIARVVAVALALLGVTAARGRAAAPINVRVGTHATARPLPADFLSLSVQFDTIPQWATATHGSSHSVLARLVDGLDPSGSPIIRVGGQGGDRTWWPVAGVTRPPGVSDTLTPRWITAARSVAAALGARYLLQVNLEAGLPSIAKAEADHFLRGLGASDIAALEIGNEPELYRSVAWYQTSDGHDLPWYADQGTPVYARGPGWDATAFVAQWRRFARALPSSLALAGPDLDGATWLSAFATQLGGPSRLRYFDVHAYPVEKCITNPDSPRYPSVAHLLTLAASRDLLAGQRQYIGRAHTHGARFIVDETGADSCGGNAGVSNTMASALWALDTLFAMDRAGVDGVDLHGLPGTANALFDLSRVHGRERARVLPAYLGARLFAQAAPAGSRLLSVSDPDQAQLRSWATVDSDHTDRVVLINDGPAREVSVRLARGHDGSHVTLERLRAHGAASTSGFVLGGRHVSQTSTGEISPRGDEYVRLHNGVYRFGIAAGSAVLVTQAPPLARGRAGSVISAPPRSRRRRG